MQFRFYQKKRDESIFEFSLDNLFYKEHVDPFLMVVVVFEQSVLDSSEEK